MKINKSYTQIIDKNKYNIQNENKKKATPEDKQSDSVEISKSAKELIKRMEELDNKNISERVEKIRKSIAEGSYKVSSNDIANKILEHMDKQKGKLE